MLIRKLLAVSIAAASLAGVSSVAQARTDVGVVVNFAPPAPKYERVPVARVGYVWTPGYWDWRSNRYAWVSGRYVASRPGYAYHPVRWTHVGNHWRYDRGYWGQSSYRHR
ncbi:hypothetical protein DSM104443_00500 [Usitatibacter rugosus]|uniref:YXWGXW repeat-containing protein n=1 Tax=Usitatibacter rugosus TaxID=2732067 RepID=A0A6M4GQW1_9PROT|nr:YXWGXW repeat-containing protein [Usitatibacter rugosus]QJR09456.1 hypothetical protein DSM104443_00500 [Usitatibacter rugosus]